MGGEPGARKKLDVIPRQAMGESLVIGLLIFGACMLGIYTRLILSLASIWPANAILLAILLCRPSANRPMTWLAAATALMAADLLSGSDLLASALLNGANLATVVGGVIAARLIDREDIFTPSPNNAMAVVVILVVGAACSSLAGAFVGPFLFGMNWPDATLLWFTSEFVNLAIFVPVILAFTSSNRNELRLLSRRETEALKQLAAIAPLLGSIALMHMIGGPGASSYVVPSLLSCAVIFLPFASAILTMFTCTWILIVAPLGLIPLNFDLSAASDASSFRLGVSMISIGVFMVSSINAAWRRTNEQLQHMAAHDSLTGLANRGAFMQSLSQQLAKPGHEKTSLLMIDVDHFKSTNDTHGHPMGDLVLQELARTLRSTLRQGSVAGRLGGEEFGVIVDGPQASAGMAVAQRVHAAISAIRIPTETGGNLTISVSIGLAEAYAGTSADQLFTASDTALYAAKHAGRNRIVALGDAPAPQQAPRAQVAKARKRRGERHPA